MKRQRKNVPDHKLDSDLHEAFAVAKPLGEVREVIALPDPRRAELEKIDSFVVRNEARHVVTGMTAEVRRAARRKLNAGQYRDTVRSVLLEFVEDPNLPVGKRIRAATALAKFLPQETRIDIHQDEVAADSVEVDARVEARRKLAAALEALK